jgi:uncharacterized membrane protein
MKTFALSYVSAAVIMLGFDAIWLTLTATPLYRARLGTLMLDKPEAVPAVVFYVLYVLGVVVLVILPAVSARSWEFALTRGALLGCIAYATYDLTNQATLRGWSPVITCADIVWGTILTAAAATGGYLVVNGVLGAA